MLPFTLSLPLINICCGLPVPLAKLTKSSSLIDIVQSTLTLSALLFVILPFFKSTTFFLNKN